MMDHIDQQLAAIDPRITARFEKDTGLGRESICLVARIGSHSHGTYLPPSDPSSVDDVDYMGVFIPCDERYHLGLKTIEHWTMKEDELDVVFYSLRKVVQLLLKGNPNVMGLLWLHEEDYIYRDAAIDSFIEARDIFTSKASAVAFAGYAHGQLKRMEAFSADRMARYETLTTYLSQFVDVPHWLALNGPDFEKDAAQFRADTNLREELTELRGLHRKYFSGYMGAKRKSAVVTHGYDVKNAAHLIRLLTMGTEFMATGVLQVRRTNDAELLKSIKRGAYPLDVIHQMADAGFAKFRAAEAASPLPDTPNEGEAERLLIYETRIALRYYF